jgi:hypothetical protein
MMDKKLEKIFDEVLIETKEPPESIIKLFMNTSFNNKFMSREEAIHAAKDLGPKLYEQTYGKNSRLYFHASDKPHDPIRESIQHNNDTGESLCFFTNNPESALAVAKARHGWDYNFCFLHVCKIKSQINLFNPQCKSDIKQVSFSKDDLNRIQDISNWLKQGWNLDTPDRWWRIYESGFIPSAIKKAGFLGIALNFWDMIYPTPEKEKTEGIALFYGNQMSVQGIKTVEFGNEIKEYNEYLKDLHTKEEIEEKYKDLFFD